MRKIKSLVLIALTSFAIAACSSGNKEVEQASVDELYSKARLHYKKEAILTRFVI